MTSPVDVDALPPTQYLILDVLTARMRLGEQFWTFPDRLKPAARALEEAGLVWTRSGPAPHAFQVWPTAAFQTMVDASDYRTPTVADGQVREQIRTAVGSYLLSCYGTGVLDSLRKAHKAGCVPGEIVRLAEWLAQENAAAQQGQEATT
jgi:hypothetical protein